MKSKFILALILTFSILLGTLGIAAPLPNYSCDFTQLAPEGSDVQYGNPEDIIELDSYTTAYLTYTGTKVSGTGVVYLFGSGTNASDGAYANGSYIKFVAPADGELTIGSNYINIFIDSYYIKFSGDNQTHTLPLKKGQIVCLGNRSGEKQRSAVRSLQFTPNTRTNSVSIRKYKDGTSRTLTSKIYPTMAGTYEYNVSGVTQEKTRILAQYAYSGTGTQYSFSSSLNTFEGTDTPVDLDTGITLMFGVATGTLINSQGYLDMYNGSYLKFTPTQDAVVTFLVKMLGTRNYNTASTIQVGSVLDDVGNINSQHLHYGGGENIPVKLFMEAGKTYYVFNTGIRELTIKNFTVVPLSENTGRLRRVAVGTDTMELKDTYPDSYVKVFDIDLEEITPIYSTFKDRIFR